MSYALQVDIHIKPENVDAFMAKLAVNAAQARTEPGCRQFDVLVELGEQILQEPHTALDVLGRIRGVLHAKAARGFRHELHEAQRPL